MVARGKRPIGARLGAQLGPRSRHPARHQRAQRIGPRVGTQQHRPVILLLHHRRFPQICERGNQLDRMFLEDLRPVQVLERDANRGIGPVQPHPIGRLRAHPKGLLIIGRRLAHDGPLARHQPGGSHPRVKLRRRVLHVVLARVHGCIRPVEPAVLRHAFHPGSFVHL